MRVLQIGLDRSKRGTLIPGTAASDRQERYAKLFGYIDDISYTLRSDGFTGYATEVRSVYPTQAPIKLLYGTFALFIALNLPKPDLISAQDPHESGLLALWIARMRRVPLHIQVHSDVLSEEYAAHSLTNRIRRRISLYVLKRADGIRVVSKRIKESIEWHFTPKRPISVLPIFVEIDRFRSATADPALQGRFSGFKTRALVVARLEPEKNVALAIEAFSDGAPLDACLIIVGTGSERARLEKLAKERGVANRVLFEGEQEGVRYYPLVDVVLVPSKFEGYGMVIIEALASGKEVISTDVGIAREAGAMITDSSHFTETLRAWFVNGPNEARLASSSYGSFDEYISAYCADVESLVPSRLNRDALPKTGLALHPGTANFLEQVHGLSSEGVVEGMPLYRNTNNKHFWGGWGSFYTVCLDDLPHAVLSAAYVLGKKYGLIEGCFSLPGTNATRHLHVMLSVPPEKNETSRMDLYDKKTRNQTKRARETSLTLSLERGNISDEWYTAYQASMRRLGVVAKDYTYFKALEKHFAKSLHSVIARDNGKVVASTVYIQHEQYAHLLFNVSLPEYWSVRVNNLVYDEMIRLCIRDGVTLIDFGLTGIRDASHRIFKEGFGGKPQYIVTRTFGSPLKRGQELVKRIVRAVSRRL